MSMYVKHNEPSADVSCRGSTSVQARTTLRTMSRPKTPAIERFNRYVEVIYGDCWEWKGHTVPGQRDTRIPGIFEGTTARRWIYQYYHGSVDSRTHFIVPPMSCNTILCVNPSHLVCKPWPRKQEEPDYNLPRFGRA